MKKPSTPKTSMTTMLNELIVGGESADDAEGEDARHQDGARHAQELLADLDRRPAERDHDQVRQDEDDEDRIDVLRVEEEQGRPGVHPLHVEDADHDRGDGVAGNAEDQRRHPGAAERGIVGGGGFDDPLDVARAVFLRGARQALADGVGDPGGDVGAGAGQRRRSATPITLPRNLLAPIDDHHAPPAGEQIADAAVCGTSRLFTPGRDAAQHLRHGEQTDHGGDEVDACRAGRRCRR